MGERCVVVRGDTTVESNETFVVNLSNPVGATIADGSGMGTITNDDVAPVLPASPSRDFLVLPGSRWSDSGCHAIEQTRKSRPRDAEPAFSLSHSVRANAARRRISPAFP